jgi:hypothetical protein
MKKQGVENLMRLSLLRNDLSELFLDYFHYSDYLQGLLFALFTSIMFGTQVSAIWYDETGIEALKKEEAR